MSYCRWSTDDFQCDIYAYGSVDNTFTIHVAGRRRVFKEPLPPPVSMEDAEGWVNRDNIVTKMLDKADLVDIDLPNAGESYEEPDLQSFLERMLQLRAEGFRFPDSAIERIRAEITEEAKGDGEPKERDSASSPRG